MAVGRGLQSQLQGPGLALALLATGPGPDGMRGAPRPAPRITTRVRVSTNGRPGVRPAPAPAPQCPGSPRRPCLSPARRRASACRRLGAFLPTQATRRRAPPAPDRSGRLYTTPLYADRELHLSTVCRPERYALHPSTHHHHHQHHHHHHTHTTAAATTTKRNKMPDVQSATI